MTTEHQVSTREGILIQDPPIARFLFADTRFAWFWLIVRVLLGWQWLDSGLGKLQNPAWMQGGTALQEYWERAVQVPETGRPPIAFDWYRSFIQGMLEAEAYSWFGPLVAIGETLIGIALIAGIFVGITAFFSAFMNWNFVMAGSASSNALLGLAALFLILAWKTAGWYGADRWLLPRLGTPWTKRKRGRVIDEHYLPPVGPSTGHQVPEQL